jgi:hypothetical protein
MFSHVAFLFLESIFYIKANHLHIYPISTMKQNKMIKMSDKQYWYGRNKCH